MSCNSSCFLNCENGALSDQCVQYTGPDIPAFGICQGDQLSSIEQVILNELQNALEGTGIEPENVTLENCSWLATQFGTTDPNLSNLLQLLIDSECSLKAMIDQINLKLTPQSTSFNTLCLQGLPTNPTPNDILQGVINLACTTNIAIASFPTTYVKNSDLNTLIQQQIIQYLANSQTGNIEYYQYFPVKVAFPYFGDIANFDNTGKGLPANGMTNIYIANGLNGTPDLRGVTITGAIRNIPGGALNSIVDPTNPNNPNWAVGDTTGENRHTITIAETPSHSHSVIDPGHKHNGSYISYIAVHGGGSTNVPAVGPANGQAPISTVGLIQNATTGITIGNTGNSQSHNNIQPTTAAIWIIRML